MNTENILPADWTDLISPDQPRLGLGIDPATTTKKRSNPTAIALVQESGFMAYVRLVLRYKTADPAIARAIIRMIISGLPHNLRIRRVCIDATNERYFAADLRRQLAGIVPVSLIVSSESTTYLGEKMSFKNYLGNLLVNRMEDGYLALPPEDWVKRSMRQVTIERGTFTADVAEDGEHGDVFDAVKNGLHAITSSSGPAEATAVAVGSAGNGGRQLKNPYAPKFQRGGKVNA